MHTKHFEKSFVINLLKIGLNGEKIQMYFHTKIRPQPHHHRIFHTKHQIAQVLSFFFKDFDFWKLSFQTKSKIWEIRLFKTKYMKHMKNQTFSVCLIEREEIQKRFWFRTGRHFCNLCCIPSYILYEILSQTTEQNRSWIFLSCEFRSLHWKMGQFGLQSGRTRSWIRQ